MKKTLIILSIIFAIFLAIPLIGNKVIDSILNDRIEVLTSYGLKVKDSKVESGYLTTHKHYIFVVEDTDKFVNYLNQFADMQLPPYVDALVGGAEVGLDLQYSNIPIEDKVSIDIYPNALPSEMAKNMILEDKSFYTYVDGLLKNKAVSYHLNYDLLNDDFDGYLKDIDEKFTLKDGSKLSLKLQGATFKGKGMIIAPDALSSDIKTLKLNIQTNTEVMNLIVSDFTSSSVFESKTTYATTGRFSTFKWNIKNNEKADVDLNLDKLLIDFSSNTQSVKADFFAKLSFDKMDITTDTTSIILKKFNQDIALRNVSKDSYEKLVTLIAKAKLNQTPQLKEEIKQAAYELISRGMILDIADFSVQDLATAKTKNLGGMSIKSVINVKQDRDFANKINTKPAALMDIIDIDFLFKMSKEMYSRLSLASPVFMMAKNFAKEEKDLFVFDIKLKDSKLSVNGKEI